MDSMIDAETQTFKQVISAVINYFCNHVFDERIDVIEQSGQVLACIKATNFSKAYKNFKDIMSEVAPETSAKAMKDELLRQGYLVVNGNDGGALYTLSDANIDKHKITGDKVYAMKFDDVDMEKIVDAFKKRTNNTQDTSELEAKKEVENA